MKVKEKNGLLEITTEVYQAKNGSLILNWGRDKILLTKQQAEIIVWDMPNFDQDKYNEFYNK